MMIGKQIFNAIKLFDAGDDGCGAECNFFIVGNKGLKVYYDKSSAKHSFEAQKKLNKVGLAPKVLSRKLLKVRKWKGRVNRANGIGYGFFTEVAKIPRRIPDYAFNKLGEKLKPYGMDYDLHEENVGKLGKKWVLIDCGPASNRKPFTFLNKGKEK